MVRLSRPQEILLRELMDDNIATVTGYKPGMALVAKGYATLHEGKLGSAWPSITPAGRAAIGGEK